MNNELKRLRSKLYQNLRDKALGLESSTSEDFPLYYKEQRKYAKRSYSISSMDELLARANNSNIIYLGDFHTFDQNIRNVIRLIRFLVQENKKCTIGLEMVDANYQFQLETYLAGQLTEYEFLDSINYHDSWRFPWTHYKVILDMAKEHNIKVLALNTEGSLVYRDHFAANIISKYVTKNPSTKFITVYGELHISPNKIPHYVGQNISDSKALIIHQNLDEVYFKEMELNNTVNEVVKFDTNEFCINSAPPWIKYESMIYWYENLSDDPEFDIHDYIVEYGKKIFNGDTTDIFYNLSTEFIKTINLEITEQLEDYSLYDHTSMEYVEDYLFENTTRRELNFYNKLIENGYSFILPACNKFYCSSYSLNRLAYIAGIHCLYTFYERPNQTKIFNGKDQVSKFNLLLLEALFAHFFSKIINPHRKCSLFMDIKKININAYNILETLDLRENLKGLRLYQIYEISLLVGHMLGDYLYERISNGEINIKIEELVSGHNLSQESFKKLFNTILKNKDFTSEKKRQF